VRITVVRGTIVDQPVDAVVTAGNRSLRGGSGVNGAVHAAAGPRLVTASRALAPCPAGNAVVTPSFDLAPARWVIHAVGPKYNGPADAETLASAYTASLTRADEVGARSVAFPSISTGIYGYPEKEAAEISVAALLAANTRVETVLLVAFGERTATLWMAALERAQS
jgi:O-acetyl-ADP-ribose deacetylase